MTTTMTTVCDVCQGQAEKDENMFLFVYTFKKGKITSRNKVAHISIDLCQECMKKDGHHFSPEQLKKHLIKSMLEMKSESDAANQQLMIAGVS